MQELRTKPVLVDKHIRAKSMRILIVDDNEMVRRGVILLLSSEPAWKVCGEASSGKEAIVKARELRPDLVLLDISMPGANGFEVAATLRRETPHAKIIIMSQHDLTQLLPRALEAGADACVDKDSLSTDLTVTIKSLVGNSDAHLAADAG
jgi:DNA-binding NarL/FixJ family response regulator